MTFDHYAARQHEPGLDGLRALSAMLVITNHVHGMPIGLAGWVGVWMFYAISGYLITTLLLREEARAGAVSLGGFYIRRFFRIVPPYAATIVLYALAAAAAGDLERFRFSLPYLATFTAELAPGEDLLFGHAWTLGVEEKFYLAFPVLAFLLTKGRARLAVTVLCLMLLLAYGTILSLSYFGLLLGALLAQILHDRRGFEILKRSTSGGSLVFGAGLVALILIGRAANASDLKAPFWATLSLLSSYLVAQAVIHRGPAWLHSRAIEYLGRRSYGIYLVHVLALNAAARVAGQGSPASIILGVTLSIALAEAMFRIVEAPAIRLGRALSHGRRAIHV